MIVQVELQGIGGATVLAGVWPFGHQRFLFGHAACFFHSWSAALPPSFDMGPECVGGHHHNSHPIHIALSPGVWVHGRVNPCMITLHSWYFDFVHTLVALPCGLAADSW